MTGVIFLEELNLMYTRKSLLLMTFLSSVIVAAVLLGSWALTNSTVGRTSELNSVEIREYEGERLGSIDDFRENSIRGPQYIDNTSYRLLVTGLVSNTTEYSYDDVVSTHMVYEKVVTIHCVEGWEVTILWEGVLVEDLLREAGYDRTAEVVIFYAQDGYSTSLPLSYIVDNDILIAHKMNGLVLPPNRGFPFQLVAESKYGYKWIKWITQIEVSNDVDYRGYWESRGYPNDADLP